METSGAVDVKGSQRSSFAARGGNRCIDSRQSLQFREPGLYL